MMQIKKIKLQEAVHMPGRGNGRNFCDYQGAPDQAESDYRLIFDPTMPFVSMIRRKCGTKCIVPIANIAGIYPGELPMTRAETIERCAMVAHETNRAYCESLGDDSQPPWSYAPDWQKESVRLGVILALDDPKLTPEGSHESWLATKRDQGWTYGRSKDIEKKTHPCMKPYSELSKEQRAKSAIFLATVRLTASAMLYAENPLRK